MTRTSDLLGAHISTKGGLHTVFERALAIEAAAIALFAKNSNQWKGKTTTAEDLALFKQHRIDAPLFTHASYLINLATTNPEFHAKAIEAMIDEIERAERLGAVAVVLHPGAHMGAGIEAGIDRIARSLDLIHSRVPDASVLTLLETAAGQGSCLGCSFEEIAAVMARVDAPGRLGVCLDTCHLFAAGYDLRTRDGYERTIDSAEKNIGLERIRLFHLNDSKKPLGSRVDRHEHIGEGALGLEPFRFLLNDARFRGVPKVIETPKTIETESDRLNLTRLRALTDRTADHL